MRIGIIVPLSGDSAEPQPDRLDGARLALREINGAGGVLPARQVELLIEDSGSDADRADERARDLLADGIVGLLGDAPSGSTLRILREVTRPGHLPHASGHSTSSLLTDEQRMQPPSDRWFFRTVPDDALQGPVLGQVIFEAGCRELAIVSLPNDYARPLAAAVRSTFLAFITASAAMGAVFSDMEIAEELASYDAEAMALAAAVPAMPVGPVCIALIAYPGSGGRFVRAWNALPPPVPAASWFGPEAIRRVAFVDEAGSCEAVRGFRGTSPITTPDTPEHRQFARSFEVSFGRPPGAFASPAYDAAALMALAIADAGSTDADAIRASVARVSGPPGTLVGAGELAEALALVADGRDIDYVGASGNVDVDELGNVLGPYELWQYVAPMPCAPTPSDSEFVRQSIVFPRNP